MEGIFKAKVVLVAVLLVGSLTGLEECSPDSSIPGTGECESNYDCPLRSRCVADQSGKKHCEQL